MVGVGLGAVVIGPIYCVAMTTLSYHFVRTRSV
jgi:hypothetical protein